METHVFEIRLTRVPKVIDEKAHWKNRATGRTFNALQKNSFYGVFKALARAGKIKVASLTDKEYEDNIQVLTVEGTKEFCEQQRANLEGMSEKNLDDFLTLPENKTLMEKAKIKSDKVIETLKGKAWEKFCGIMMLQSIFITLDVYEKKGEVAILSQEPHAEPPLPVPLPLIAEPPAPPIIIEEEIVEENDEVFNGN